MRRLVLFATKGEPQDQNDAERDWKTMPKHPFATMMGLQLTSSGLLWNADYLLVDTSGEKQTFTLNRAGFSRLGLKLR